MPPDRKPASAEEVVKGLTKAQRVCLVPGPGNPEYARGHPASMEALKRKGVISYTYQSADGGRSGRLTPLGQQVRALLLTPTTGSTTR